MNARGPKSSPGASPPVGLLVELGQLAGEEGNTIPGTHSSMPLFIDRLRLTGVGFSYQDSNLQKMRMFFLLSSSRFPQYASLETHVIRAHVRARNMAKEPKLSWQCVHLYLHPKWGNGGRVKNRMKQIRASSRPSDHI